MKVSRKAAGFIGRLSFLPSPDVRRKAAAVAAAGAAVLAMAWLDLSSRARTAYRRAERLDLSARRPAEREASLERVFLDGVAVLDRRRASGAEREIDLEILRKRWEEGRLRSPWAEAYHAWRDVCDLYAPPETWRTRRARLLAPAARQKWREDWKARGLPYSETLLDLEPGETEGYRLLVTTTDGREASQILTVLETLDVPDRMIPPGGAPGDHSIRILVPEDRFWEAHQALRPLVGLDENW
jgi:hypothetical protein